MTIAEITTTVTAVIALVVGIWNRFGIQSLDVKFDGFMVRYARKKRDAGYKAGVIKGVKNEQDRSK